jgi:hypothetical protein
MGHNVGAFEDHAMMAENVGVSHAVSGVDDDQAAIARAIEESLNN